MPPAHNLRGPVTRQLRRSAHTELPLRTKSLANEHSHWRVRAARAKAERLTTRVVLGRMVPLEPEECALVTLTRIAPRDLDSDNLPPSMKSIRDELAACLGLDDRSPRIVWHYQQRRAAKGQERYAVEVLVEVFAAEREPLAARG